MNANIYPFLAFERFSPQEAFTYALQHCHERIPEIEAIIKNHAEYAYKYAHLVLCKRWVEAENTISKSPEFGYYYALEVILGKFPEAESLQHSPQNGTCQRRCNGSCEQNRVKSL